MRRVQCRRACAASFGFTLNDFVLNFTDEVAEFSRGLDGLERGNDVDFQSVVRVTSPPSG